MSRAHAAMPMMVTRPSSGPSSDSVRAIAVDERVVVGDVDTIGNAVDFLRDAFGALGLEVGDRDARAGGGEQREVLSPMPCPPPRTRMRLPSRPKSGATIGQSFSSMMNSWYGSAPTFARDLDAAALDEDRRSRRDRGLEVRRQRAGAVGFLHRGDAVAAEDHEDVVELVLVHVAVGTGREGELPDPHPVVLEHDLVAHRSEHSRLVAHDFSSRSPPMPCRQNCTRWSVSPAVGRVPWSR